MMMSHHSSEMRLFADAVDRLDEALLAMVEYPALEPVAVSIVANVPKFAADARRLLSRLQSDAGMDI